MRIARILTYAVPLLALCTIPREASHAQENSVRIEFAGDSARGTVIGAFRRSGTVYVSLNDLAHLFSLPTYESPESQKFEIKRLPMRLKATGGNPFLVVTDSTGRQSAYQLPSRVVYAANSYFVPLASFIPLLRPVLGISASYNAWTGVLGIGSAAAAPAFDIPSVRLESKSNGATRKLGEYENWMRADGWLYVTVGDARADIAAINAVRPAGIVRQIIAIQSPTSVQLTFKLSGKIATTEIMTDESSNDLILVVRTPGAEETEPAHGTEKGNPLGVGTGPLSSTHHEAAPSRAAPHKQDTISTTSAAVLPSPGNEPGIKQWPTILPPPKPDIGTSPPTALQTAQPEDTDAVAAGPPAPRREHESSAELDTERGTASTTRGRSASPA